MPARCRREGRKLAPSFARDIEALVKTVMIISDATGETAERMVRAATLQFSEPVQIRLFSRVRLETELEQILEKAHELKALVVFTVVNNEERDLISKLVEKYNIEIVDLM